MTRVKKGGSEYVIDDALVDEYLAKGYCIIDARGNTIRTGSPTNYAELLTENAELRQATKRLEASNAALAEEISALKAENESLKAAQTEPPAEDEKPGETEPPAEDEPDAGKKKPAKE